ncbi:MAG: hypothetical protein ACRCYP_01815 [Alphaproteobacteria bacterium]
MNRLKPFYFIFFILFSTAYGENGDWEENLSDANSIDSGDAEMGNSLDEEGEGSRKNVIEESAKTRTKEALKGFLDDAIDGNE